MGALSILGLAAAYACGCLREQDGWRRRAALRHPPGRGGLPSATVLVPTLNEAEYVGDCLRDLRAQTALHVPGARIEILVIDSGSGDATAEVAAKYADALVDAPRGKLQALARGTAAASGDVIVEADADALLPPRWLEAMLRPFAVRRVVGVYGPVLYHDSPLASLANAASLPINQALGKFPAGARAYRRDAFEAAGGFHEVSDESDLLRLWREEEFAFAARLRRLGHVLFIPEALCYKSARRLDPVFVRDERAKRFRAECAAGARFSLRAPRGARRARTALGRSAGDGGSRGLLRSGGDASPGFPLPVAGNSHRPPTRKLRP